MRPIYEAKLMVRNISKGDSKNRLRPGSATLATWYLAIL